MHLENLSVFHPQTVKPAAATHRLTVKLPQNARVDDEIEILVVTANGPSVDTIYCKLGELHRSHGSNG